MKNKKTIYILVSILAVCLLGVVLSKVINWPVDTSKSSGNIAKTSRFNRKTASDGASNMQELLLNDEEFKNGVVAAYLVMDARANQFNALVDASDEVAGSIPAFSDVLKDMKAAKPMLSNVCAQMKTLASDLDAVLGGETRADLAQNTTNAALAYNTLQKSNNLATRFIDAADAYLAKNAGDDRLKFIRDQWVDYQSVTAALEQDKKAADAMAEKGHLLSAEKSATALASLGQNVAGIIANASGVNVLICSNVMSYGASGTVQANAGTVQANAGTVQANAGTIQANAGTIQANAGTIQANAGTVQANAGTIQANAGTIQANAGTIQANAGTIQANAGTIQANAGTIQANAGTIQANAGTIQANAGTIQANAGTIQANAGTIQANAGTIQANAGTIQANSGVLQSNLGHLQQAIGTLQATQGSLNMDGGMASLSANVGSFIQSAAQGTVQSNSGVLQFF